MIEYIKNKQKILYKTIFNSKVSNRVPHAILLNGSKDIPLKELSRYIAGWIASSETDLDINDPELNRFINGLRPDYIFINGEEGMIKKGQIESLREQFSLSSIEDGAKKVYVIHLIEKANAEAVNSLLKFLEEPDAETYAIITTENISLVLPTIVSRCLNIRLSKASKDELVEMSVKDGVPLEDALILSSFNGGKDEILECYNNKKYISVKDAVIELLDTYKEGKDIYYFASSEQQSLVADKDNFRLYLDVLQLALSDALNYGNRKINFIEHQDLIAFLHSNFKGLDDKLLMTNDFYRYLDFNANTKLLFDRLIIELKRGEEK